MYKSLAAFLKLMTHGTMPPSLREKMGIEWTAKREKRFNRVAWLIKNFWPLMPEKVRYTPLSYQARKGEVDLEALYAKAAALEGDIPEYGVAG